MCLAVPGEVRSIADGELRTGRVAFGSVVKPVCLAYVPEARVGDWVIVHAGFAISLLDREAAARTLAALAEAEALAAAGAGSDPASVPGPAAVRGRGR